MWDIPDQIVLAMASNEGHIYLAGAQHRHEHPYQRSREHLTQSGIPTSKSTHDSTVNASYHTPFSFSEYDPQQWQNQQDHSFPKATFYGEGEVAPATDVGAFTSDVPGSYDSNLHSLTSLSPSTAQDHLSPSNFGSDMAIYGDAFSEASFETLRFGISHENTQSPVPIDIQGTTSGMTAQFPLVEEPFSFPDLYQCDLPLTSDSLGQSSTSAPGSHVFATNTSSVPSPELPRPQQQQPHFVITTADGIDGASKRPQIYKRRSSSRKSNAYLLPPDAGSSSEDEDVEIAGSSGKSETQVQNLNLRHQEESGSQPRKRIMEQAEISLPDTTSANNHPILSLNEAETQRLSDERHAVVEDWLDHSEVGSSAEDEEITKIRRKTNSRPRAKSTNDARTSGRHDTEIGQNYFGLFRNIVPGPGLTLNEPSELDDDGDDDSAPESTPESPPSEFPFACGIQEDSLDSIFPGNYSISANTHKSVEGITANLAMMRFAERANEIDSASVAATLGSRRLSESDLGSVRGAAGISKLLLAPSEQSPRAPARRKSSLLEHFLPSRGNSQKLKRKQSHAIEQQTQEQTTPGFPSHVIPPKRIGSFGRSKSPKLDTNVLTVNDAKSPKTVASAASGALKHMWRSRSRSDLSKAPGLGLKELMTQHGGPPMPTLASPAQTKPSAAPFHMRKAADDDSEDDDACVVGAATGFMMDLSVRTDMPIIPTYDGFKYQVLQLNPRIVGFLKERVTQEQIKRFKKLVELKSKHFSAVSSGSCLAKSFCLMSGGSPRYMPPRAGSKDAENSFIGFQIMKPGMTEDDLEHTPAGQMIAASFPSGVPLPPVDRLPAEFECPKCFKIKKFYKPSDWTKHLHEDVQPFTCTFPNCNEPKSFKRKADWVRHENERHRQLEYWVCDFSECQHTCYRKDNFVQHLVREHKISDPKTRLGRDDATKKASLPLDPSKPWPDSTTASVYHQSHDDDVWTMVDRCHHEATKRPEDEPCKFCGNVCTSWKNLTVHLAKHMEQIAMPVLAIVEQTRRHVGSGPYRSTHLPQPMPAANSTNDFSSVFYEEPTSIEPSLLGVPQPNVGLLMSSQQSSELLLQTPQNYTTSPNSLSGTSYPPPSIHSRSRGSSFHGHDPNTQQGTTYPPMGISTHTMTTGSYKSDFGQALVQQRLQEQQLQRQQQYPSVMYSQEPAQMGNVNPYLTPNSGTYSHSPEGSMYDLQQTYGGGYQS